MATIFVWDTVKAVLNEKKHGVSFGNAARAFSNPFKLDKIDQHEHGEPRWRTIAMLDGVLILLIAHTDWEEEDCDVVRIISARPATARERNRYEQNRYQNRP
jgi:uncharacterized protein